MRLRAALLAAAGVLAAILTWLVLVPLVALDGITGSPAARLSYAAAALLPAGAVLAAIIAAQMAARFAAGAFDPLAGNDTEFLARNQRVLTNTVEQTVLFAPALLALATAVPGAALAQVLALGPVFALARLAFWAGYLVSPVARAPGMAATFAVAASTLVAAAWFWLV